MRDPWDLPAGPARKVKRRLTEGKIQKACVAFARSLGYWARKFSSPSQKGVPDYEFAKLWPTGLSIKWAEEFKAPGEVSTENQEEEQRLMREAGWLIRKDTGTNGQADIDAFKARLRLMDEIGNGALAANWPI